jgi:hypothetical protein
MAAVNAALEADALRRVDELGARLFLLTDSQTTRNRLSLCLGSRLLMTKAIRSDDIVGLHLSGRHDPRRLGEEVMVDTYLAARCDEFFGCTASNVACMVARMWSERPGLTMRGGVPTHAQVNSYAMTCERSE